MGWINVALGEICGASRLCALAPSRTLPPPGLPQPLTHILVLDVESLLEIVDGGGAGFDSLAQRGATGNDAAEAPWGSAPVRPPPAAPAPTARAPTGRRRSWCCRRWCRRCQG